MRPMFEFALAKTAGFCWGVERAIHGAEGKREKAGEELYVLGRLVHNRDAVEDLEEKGIRVIADMGEARGKPLVITAHGRDPKDIARAKAVAGERNVLDMTCPIVKDLHQAALALAREGRRMILIGIHSRPHPEVEGTVGVLDGEVCIVETVQEAWKIPYPPGARVGVVAQTTFDEKKVTAIFEIIARRYPGAKYLPTLCDDISRKQKELRERAHDFDTVIVVGDSGSANSRHLAEIARELGKRTLFILNGAELVREPLEGAKRVFVTAGASTPPRSIEGVLAKLESFGGIHVSD